MPTVTVHPVAELRRFIFNSKAIASAKRYYHELLGWEACEDIAADIAAQQRQIVDATHKAETLDREAVKLLDAVLSDGRVTAEEVAAVKKARTLAAQSAEVDHDASELAHVAA